MTLEQTDPSSPPFWAFFNHTFALPIDTPLGEYSVVVKGIESNGVTYNYTHYIYVLSDVPSVSIYPDHFSSTMAPNVVAYAHTVKNLNNKDSDVFDITALSSQGWGVSVYMADGMTFLPDTDGDGIPDTGSVPPGGSVGIVVKVAVPESALNGTVDYMNVTATSSLNTSVNDSATDITEVVLFPPPQGKTLHLHSGYTMDTFPGSAVVTDDIPNGGTRQWTQTPDFADDFDLAGEMVATIYIRRRAFSSATVTVTLSYDGTTIGSDTQTVTPSWGYIAYTFTIIPSIDMIPKGNAITLTYYTNRRTYVRYDDGTNYDSRIDMTTQTFVNVTDIKTYNASTLVETENFSAGEAVLIKGNVTDPFGSYDISGAEITIEYPNGSTAVTDASMILEQIDPTSPSAWKLFNYTHTLPSDAPVGDYKVYVKGIESNGVVFTKLATFCVPTNVSVEPDNTGVATSGTSINYTHYINNTGRGADRFEITVNSENGFNITLYDSSDQMMAYDTNGDGIWEWVSSTHDSNGNGNPDTGILLPGETFQIRIKVDIPSDTLVSEENTTVTATSAAFLNIYDSARDHTLIPEFSDVVIPLIGTLLCFWFYRRKRLKGRRKAEKEGEENG